MSLIARRQLLLPILVIAALLLVTSPALADYTIDVNTNVDEDVNNSSCSLREAVIAAFNNANYNGCTRTNVGGPPTVDIINLNAAGPYQLLSTITYDTSAGAQGDLTINGNGNTVQGNDTFQLFYINLASADKFSFTGATIRDGGGAVNGGAFYLNGNGSLLCVNLISNQATNGGAVYVASNAAVLYMDCPFPPNAYQITNNSATGGGGAIYEYDGRVLIFGAFTIAGNSAGTQGGALYIAPGSGGGGGSQLEISGGTATNGEIYNAGFVPGQIQSNFSGQGGAIYWDSADSRSTINDTCIAGNSRYAIYGTIGNKLDAPNNWWASDWGPRIENAETLFLANGYPSCGANAYCTASAVTLGDSINGDGSNSAGQGVDISNSNTFPAAYGDGNDNNPTNNGQFVHTNPNPSVCLTCQGIDPSSLDPDARTCVLPGP
ncbi:MAG: CSLREA domain-containing protein [Anaerolineae bacterium]|nr:CSLREA domain-containing protein [Anaerolineae bacterium]